jgi:MOSC domain-containing protein YiiM
MATAGELVSLNVGKPQTVPYKEREVTTAIFKHAVDGPIYLEALNFQGDGQADLVHHGGPDKAVNAYCREHYSFWERELGIELPTAAFGENLTVGGMLEKDVYIGDVYQIGEAILQVCQPRIPCFKIELRLDREGVLPKIHETGYSGYYFRVLQEGHVSAADRQIKLLERDPNSVTVAFVNQVFYKERDNKDAIRRILEVESLAVQMREILQKLLNAPEQDE